MKKILLLSTASLAMLMADFTLEGDTLTPVSGTISTVADSTPLTAAGCQGTYDTTVNVNSMSALSSAVANANTSTKIVLANGTYTTNTTLDGNTAAVCVQAATQNQAVIQSHITLSGNNITLDGLLFNGGNIGTSVYDNTGGYVMNHGVDNRLTRCTWDNSQNRYWVQSWQGGLRFTIDYCTFKNKMNNASIDQGMVIQLRNYEDVITPSEHYIHHNYFYNMVKGDGNGHEVIQLRTQASQTDDSQVNGSWNPATTINDANRVEYNLFVDCDGENELISSKSKGTIIMHNTNKGSEGAMQLRFGDDGIIAYNYIMGTRQSNGIVVQNRNQSVHHNYVTGCLNKGSIEVYNGNADFDNTAPATPFDVRDNYIADGNQGLRFGRDIVGTDLLPVGVATNNVIIRCTTPIYNGPIKATQADTSGNIINPAIDPGWDMSGVLTTADVGAGI